MTGGVIRRSASGARQGGDDYQHLVAWNRILRALLPGRHLVEVELEAIAAGNVDDVVVHHRDTPSQYAQVRFAVDLTTPLNSAYLLDRSERGTSMLQKFHRSFERLRSEGTPELILITNRLVDPTDRALTALNHRTGLLVPAMADAGAGSPLGGIRAEWVAHLECSEEELFQLLKKIRFWVGRGYDAEEECASDYMAAHGMQSDARAVRLGIDRVRRWVLDGHRRLSSAAVADGIAELDIGNSDPAAVLHVQALFRDPTAADATEVLDWIEHFSGTTLAERRATTSPDLYSVVMQPELEAAAERLMASGHHRVVVRGAMRLAPSFAVGAALPRVRGMELVRRQGAAQWSTDASPSERRPGLVATETILSEGADVVVVVGIAADPTRDVLAFVRAERLAVDLVLSIGPHGGPDDTFVDDEHTAVAIAQEVRELSRRAVRDRPGANVHLFLACPAALATMIGHRWNRVAPTMVYEDLNPSYQAAFRIGA